MYSENIIARWNDTDAALHVRPSQILTYMQECAWSHLNAIGQNLEILRDAGLAFILTRIATRYYRPIAAREEVVVETWVTHEDHGFFFPRYFRISGTDGQVIADAGSIWVLLNIETHAPITVDQFQINVAAEAPLDILIPRRFKQAPDMVIVGERRVGYSDADYNGHMNNTRYPDMLCDHLPEGVAGHIRSMGMNFLQEAPFGKVIQISRGERRGEDGKKVYTFSTRNEAGESCLEAQIGTDLAWEGGEDSCH